MMIIQKSLFEEMENMVIEKRQRGKKSGSYDFFVEKFKPKKTTDDCYTPQPVYDAVLSFCDKHFPIMDRPIVRPFYPGGDYQHYDYPDNCVVIDNPPFSIYSEIVRFYLSRGIDFFLFAPHLTLFVSNADCSYVLTNAKITYENGAKVNTSFATSMLEDTRIWLCPKLAALVEAASQKVTKKLLKYCYPDNVVTSALLGKFMGKDFRISKSQSRLIANLDFLRNRQAKLFGSGFLVSDSVAEQLKNGLRQESGPVVNVQLSEKEKDIILKLGG